jgi:hypothetical protein
MRSVASHTHTHTRARARAHTHTHTHARTHTHTHTHTQQEELQTKLAAMHRELDEFRARSDGEKVSPSNQPLHHIGRMSRVPMYVRS